MAQQQWWQGQNKQQSGPAIINPAIQQQGPTGYGGAAANALNSMAGNNTGGSFSGNLRDSFITRENLASAVRGNNVSFPAMQASNGGTGAIGMYGTQAVYPNAMNAMDPFTGIQVQGPYQPPPIPENAPDWFQAPAPQQQAPFQFGQQEYSALMNQSGAYTKAQKEQQKYIDWLATRTRTGQQTKQWSKARNKAEYEAELAKRTFSDMMGQFLGQDFGGSDPMALLGAYGGTGGFDPYLSNLISSAIAGMGGQQQAQPREQKPQQKPYSWQ